MHGSRRRGTPPPCRASRSFAKAIKPDTSDEQLNAYYAEDNMRKILY